TLPLSPPSVVRQVRVEPREETRQNRILARPRAEFSWFSRVVGIRADADPVSLCLLQPVDGDRAAQGRHHCSLPALRGTSDCAGSRAGGGGAGSGAAQQWPGARDAPSDLSARSGLVRAERL